MLSTHRIISPKTALLLVAVAVFGCGCFERQLRPVNPCTTSNVGRRISIENVDSVDLLFMVDNSNSMAQEQGLLRMEIPRMVQVLADGDRDRDGMRDFTPVRSMHVGIITSDLGAGNVPAGDPVPSCDTGLGDDGIMRNTSRGGMGCLATYPNRVFNFTSGTDDPMTFAATVGCVADLGTGGCGFEQQLEVILKALSPSTRTPYVASFYTPQTFFGGTLGHGDDPSANDGFLRANSALAIVLLSDEEDCSVPAYEIFYPSDPFYLGTPLNLRCSRFPMALHSPQRYVDGFIQLRESPNLLIFAPIVGVPADLPMRGATYEEMLADSRMMEMEDTMMDPPQRLLPSCSTADGVAYPPRRIVEVARGLRDRGASTTVQSICASSFGPAIDVIIEKIADALGGACLPRALNQGADGTVGCDVFELLPAPSGTIPVENTTCMAQGLEFVAEETIMVGDTPVRRELCLVPQVNPTDGSAGMGRGWWYDNRTMTVMDLCSGNESPQRIAFINLMPPTGSEVRLSCNQAILPESGTGTAQLGTFCDPATDGNAVCMGGTVPSMVTDIDFACDAITRTCQVPCANPMTGLGDDSRCARAGLLSYVCDTRPLSEVTGVPADGDAPYNFCINPTCD